MMNFLNIEKLINQYSPQETYKGKFNKLKKKLSFPLVKR